MTPGPARTKARSTRGHRAQTKSPRAPPVEDRETGRESGSRIRRAAPSAVSGLWTLPGPSASTASCGSCGTSASCDLPRPSSSGTTRRRPRTAASRTPRWQSTYIKDKAMEVRGSLFVITLGSFIYESRSQTHLTVSKLTRESVRRSCHLLS